jgi:hypothetical protein
MTAAAYPQISYLRAGKIVFLFRDLHYTVSVMFPYSERRAAGLRRVDGRHQWLAPNVRAPENNLRLPANRESTPRQTPFSLCSLQRIYPPAISPECSQF